MSSSSLQFGPEWMRKAPSKSSSPSANATPASSGPFPGGPPTSAAKAGSGGLPGTHGKRNPSLGSMSSSGPAPVISPSAVPSPGGFSFAAAAAAAAAAGGGGGGAGSGSGAGSGNGTAEKPPTHLARDHSHPSLSLYSSKEGSRGSLSPTAPQPDSLSASLHEDANSSPAGSRSNRKLFADRESSRRSFSTEGGGGGGGASAAGSLSPSIGAEPRGLNARGFASADRDSISSNSNTRPGLFHRASSTAGSKVTTPGSATGMSASADTPSAPRERFSGIQGGVLSGVAPPERRRKESEGGGARASRHHGSVANPPVPSAEDVKTLWERRAVHAGTDEKAPLQNLPTRADQGHAREASTVPETNGDVEANHRPAGASPWSDRRRDRAPGEGPIGPTPDGSGGFSKFAGYDRKRERTAGHTTDSWRSASGSHRTSANGSEHTRPINGKSDSSDAGERTELRDHGVDPDSSDIAGGAVDDASVLETIDALQSLSAGRRQATEDHSAQPNNAATAPAIHWSAEHQNWLYRDPSGQVQGPFGATIMQEWYEQSYFTNDLMVRPEQEAEFHPLSQYIEASGRNPKLFLLRPPPLHQSETHENDVLRSVPLRQQEQQQQQQAPRNQQFAPQHSPFQQHDLPTAFGSPALAHLQGGANASSPAHAHMGLGQSAWGEQQPHSYPYMDNHMGGGWPGQHLPQQHPHHPSPFGGVGHMMGAGPFGYGSPFRSQANLPGAPGEMSLDARLQQQDEYVAMIRQREAEEQARQSATRGMSFGQFSAHTPNVSSDVFGPSSAGGDRTWLPRDSSAWGGEAAGANQSPWAPPSEQASSRHGVARVPWDDSITSSGEHIQPIGTPVRARSPVNASVSMPSDVADTPSKLEQAETTVTETTPPQDARETEPTIAEQEIIEDTQQPEPAQEPSVEEVKAIDEARPATPEPEDPAPEQDWPQSPSAVEFAAEPDFGRATESAAGGRAAGTDHKTRAGNAVAQGRNAQSFEANKSAAAMSSSAAGNVQVVGAEQFRRGGRGNEAQQQAQSVQTPLSSLMPGSSAANTPTSAAKAAPWAQQADESQQQPAAMSLREIQEAEAQQAQARRAAEKAAAQRRAAAAAASANGLPSSPSTKLPTTMSWGLASIPSNAKNPGSTTTANGRESPIATSAPAPWSANKATPKKTLMEIQEEERKRVAAQQQLKSVQAAAARKAYAESATRQAAPATAPGPGWSVVGAGGKTTSSAANSTASNAVSNGVASSPAVRPAARTATSSSTAIPGVAGAWGAPGGNVNGNAASVRKSSSAVVPTSTSNSSVSSGGAGSNGSASSPSPEFIRYCKEQLRGLNSQVDGFLEMFLSFPLDPSADVVEIIAESIYAHSSTLDGRRLANDLVQKRKMDAGINDSWSTATGGSHSGGSGAASGSAGGVSGGAGGASAKGASQHGFQQVVKKGAKKRGT